MKIRSTIFSDRCMLPLSMPVSNSATAFPSISRAGSAKFDLGAEHTSKHITIYGVRCYTEIPERGKRDIRLRKALLN